MIESPPQFDVLTAIEELKPEAEKYKEVFNNYLWNATRMHIEQQLNIRCALTVGSGHIRTSCHPQTRQIISQYRNPFCFFPAPNERNIQEMPYFIESRLVSKLLLKEYYGKEIDDIKRTTSIAYEVFPDMEMESAKGLWAGIKESTRQVATGLGEIIKKVFPGSSSDNERLFISEFWVKDLTMTGDTRVYPTWRYYVKIEDVIVQDEVWTYPFIPVIKTDDYTTEGYWGRGEIEWIESPQMLLNKFISQICNYMDMIANPPLKTEVGAGLPEGYTALAGEPIILNRGFFDKLDFLRVPPLPPEFLAMLNTLIKIIDDISGQRMGMPTRTATQAFMFKESEQQRMKLKVLNMEDALLQWACQCKRYIQNHWIDNNYSIVYRDKAEKIQSIRLDKLDETENFILNIMTGSTVATSRMLRTSQLAVLPELDLEEKLKTLNWPNADRVVKRIEEKKLQITELQNTLVQLLQENQQLKKSLQEWMNYGEQQQG